MLRVPAMVTVLAFGLACGAHAGHYHVYLLGGQSNANGRGDASQLTGPLASPQTDVRFYWHRTQATTNVGWLLEDQWIDLAPTCSTTEFRLYGYNVASSTGGIRYDDIKLFGATQAVQTEPAGRAFFRVRLLP